MPNTAAIQNSFIGGFKTEYTGLNFPENACTQVNNFVFTITGDVVRRGGINFETNYNSNPATNTVTFGQYAQVTYHWKNVGGDGLTQMVVVQQGPFVYFYRSSTATITSPLSTQIMAGQVLVLTNYVAQPAGVFDQTVECQFADGNGVLFVFHPNCEPIYITYNTGTNILTPNVITVKQRDFIGAPEPGTQFNFRPPNLTLPHQYNLLNQGWTQSPPWTGNTSSAITFSQIGGIFNVTLSSQSNTTSTLTGTTLLLGAVCCNSAGCAAENCYATVTAYNASAATMTIQITSTTATLPGTVSSGNVIMSDVGSGNLGIFLQATGTYPSNADQWWEYKNSAGAFSPSTTLNNVTLDNAPAPNGYYILNSFFQTRQAISGIPFQDVTTAARPRTGAWYQGRAWYAGVDASFTSTNTNAIPFYTWTENVYFSQVVLDSLTDLTGGTQFGNCYQINDPTSESLNALLPTDGGVINIQGAGSIFKLFPIINGILVFASNGIWLISGSQGLGFVANDYSVNKISNIRCLSGTSYIDVYGYPVFWNEEGIWTVTPNTDAVPYGHGGLKVENLCIGTILSYYNTIPLVSKKYAHGAFDPINFTIQWLFRSTNETNTFSRYQYDTVLTLNVINRAFGLYTIGNGGLVNVSGVLYVDSPGGSSAPNPVFKYLTTWNFQPTNTIEVTFSEENDFTNYVDFISFNGTGFNYTSSFQAGYALHGQAIKKWDPEYIYMYIRNPSIPSTGGVGTGYNINGIWDYATVPDSGRISNAQQVIDFNPNYTMSIRRHRVRGRGYAFQLQVSSVPGLPLDIMGWSIYEHQAAGP